jgi:hypothetical protein
MTAVHRRPAYAIALALYLAWIAASIDEVFFHQHRGGLGLIAPGDYFKVYDTLLYSTFGGVAVFLLAVMLERVWPGLDRSPPAASPRSPSPPAD